MSQTTNAILEPIVGRRERTMVAEIAAGSSVKLQARLTNNKWVDTGDTWDTTGSYDFFQGDAILQVIVTGTAEWEVY